MAGDEVRPQICGAEHPDFSMVCLRRPHEDQTHECYSEIWTDGDPDAEYNERTAFWMSWTRLTIAWGLVLVGALIMLTGHWDATLHIAAIYGAIGAGACVAKLAWDAVRFIIDERRDRRESQ